MEPAGDGLQVPPLCRQPGPRARPQGRPPDRPRRAELDLAQPLAPVERSRQPGRHPAALSRLAEPQPLPDRPAPRATGRAQLHAPHATAPENFQFRPRRGLYHGNPDPIRHHSCIGPRSGAEDANPRPPRGAEAPARASRAVRAALRRHTQPGAAPRRQPARGGGRGGRGRGRDLGASRSARQLGPLRRACGRRAGHGARAPSRRLPAPATAAGRAPRRGHGPRSARRQLHPAVRRPASARARGSAGLGRERVARRRAGRGVHPPHPASRPEGRRRPRRGPLRSLARGQPDSRLRRRLVGGDTRAPPHPARRAGGRAHPPPARRSAHAREPRGRARGGRGEPGRRRGRDRLAVHAGADGQARAQGPRGPSVVRGVAAAMQRDLAVHRLGPAPDRARGRRRLRPPSTAPGRESRSRSRSGIRKESRDRPSPSIRCCSTPLPARASSGRT